MGSKEFSSLVKNILAGGTIFNFFGGSFISANPPKDGKK